MADFITTVNQITITQVQTICEMWQLAIEKGDTNSKSKIIILLRVKDENGMWRDDIPTKRIEIIDTEENSSATLFRELILDAAVSDSPIAQQFGIVGQQIRDAGQVIIAALE